MGAKKVLYPYNSMDAVAVSGTNTYLSQPTNVTNLDNVGLQIVWTGTPTGVITVQSSPDNVLYDDFVFNPILDQPAGAAGHIGVNLNQVPFLWVRVQYVNASGAGTMTVKVVAKDMG